MKKLKAKILKARSFLSVKTYKHPMLFMIALMIFLNIVILCIAALIAMGIDSSFTGFIDAFANGSLKWMLTPNAILQIDNPDLLMLAVVVLVIGMVLFTGTIIALTTNTIKEYFQRKKEGSGKIYLDDHVVILNWNNKVPELVADLLHVDHGEIKVVILADVDKMFAEKQILNAINKNKRNDKELANLNVLVKSGEPLLLSDLDDISIEEANSILIMNKDLHETVLKDMSKSDLNVIKVILSVGRINFQNDPPIVAEIKKIETKEKIFTMAHIVKNLHEHKVMPICFDRRLGQIIAQTIICPKMEDVYLSLFSFEDSEVYHLANTDFEYCLYHHNKSIPLAKSNDDLFVLSLDDITKNYMESKEYELKTLKINRKIKSVNINVFIVGTNNKLKFIMESFKEYEELYESEFKAKYIEEELLHQMVIELNASDKPATVVLLSDEHQDIDSLDANVIDNLIYLQGNLKKDNVNIIVELLDPKNDHIIKDFDIENTIISNKIISLLLSKLALYKETAPFYENLLTIASDITGKDDQNILILKTSDFIKEDYPLSFGSIKEFVISVYESSKKVFMPIGLFKDNKLTIFSGDMNTVEDIEIKAEDYIVLMKI